MKAQHTRAAILRTAIRLFNETGTRAISTNHIAEAMGVSPGIIYYHYRNKEEIIRAIYAEIVCFFNRVRKVPRDRVVTLDDLLDLTAKMFHYLWEYRFFLREATSLMQRDALLKQRFREVQRRRMVQVRHFFKGLILGGVMREPADPQALEALATITWIVTNNWLNHLMVDDGPLGPENVRKGVELMLYVLRPHLTEQAAAELDAQRIELRGESVRVGPAAGTVARHQRRLGAVGTRHP